MRTREQQSNMHLAVHRLIFAFLMSGVCHMALASNASTIHFATDIVPILTKHGCNSGGCHGKATGQNGFKLSLLGFEPNADYLAIVKQARGRRVFPADANRSLLLLKATGDMPHGGGRRIDEGSDDYIMLQRWIALGTRPPHQDDPQLERIELSPARRVLATSSSQQITVTAYFTDGTTRDVTRQAIYESNAKEIATISENGLIQTDRQTGLFSVMVRFGGNIATFHSAVPLQVSDEERREVNAQLVGLENHLDNRFDRLLIQQWRRLGITPSGEADDSTFIRRAAIDICGTLPIREEIENYLADTGPDRRARCVF